MFAFTLVALFAIVAAVAAACLIDTALRARGIVAALREEIVREKMAVRYPLPSRMRAPRAVTADLRRSWGVALDPHRAAA